MKMYCLDIQNLSVAALQKKIVDNVSFHIQENEIMALVGESGSGKTMISRSIMGLLPSPLIQITHGAIYFQEHNLIDFSEAALRRLRGEQIAYIPQSPLHALNPIMVIGRQLIEASHTPHHIKVARERAIELLKRVGFLHPELVMKSLPHQLSGGMRQRVLIAMALMNKPKLLIADEPTTALDVTLQSEILELLLELKTEYGLSILFITHDLGIVARTANRVTILRHGQIVEEGTVNNVFYQPKAAYTKMLLDSLLTHPHSHEKYSISSR